MNDNHRSGCPINLSVELIGDRWSLVILRDMIFGGRRHFRELLRSQEGISSNILADRLRMLVETGMLTKADDPTHKQKAVYSLTEMSIALVPVLAELGAWGRRYLPVTEDLAIRAQLLEEGGAAMWDQFMTELRQEHLGAPSPRGRKKYAPSVREALQSAYEEVVRRMAREGRKRSRP